MHRTPVVPGSIGLLLLASAPLFAQVEDKDFLEEQRRQEMEERERKRVLEEEYRQDFLFDYGAWFRSEIIRFDDEPERDHRTIRFFDLRVWGSATLWRRYHVYVRLINQYTDFNTGDQFEGDTDDNEFRVLRLDEGYIEADWSDWLGEGDQFRVKLGRQYFRLGRGLVYSNVANGLQADLQTGAWSFDLFGAHSIISEDDIDRSRPDKDDSHRLFIGAQVGWQGLGEHTIYALAMVQRDFNRENDSLQDYDYHSNYIGLGGRGPIIDGLSYQAELVYEFGSSVGAGSTDDESIGAWSLSAMLEYFPGWPTSPIFHLEYLFGSGDSDRGSPTDTISGNATGTDDDGFLAFGFIQTGFSLFPRVSNIHILKFDAAFRPLEGTVELLKTLEIGAAFYWYRKDQEEETISDPRAFLFDRDIGTEIDIYARWRPLSDLGISVNFGRFMPGDAYDGDNDDVRNFISIGVTYTF